MRAVRPAEFPSGASLPCLRGVSVYWAFDSLEDFETAVAGLRRMSCCSRWWVLVSVVWMWVVWVPRVRRTR